MVETPGKAIYRVEIIYGKPEHEETLPVSNHFNVVL
jgi:hypothetical protein